MTSSDDRLKLTSYDPIWPETVLRNSKADTDQDKDCKQSKPEICSAMVACLSWSPGYNARYV